MVFAVGYIGSVTEEYFHTTLRALGIPQGKLAQVTRDTITATLGAFDKMSKERGAAINEPPLTGRAGRRWRGEHGPLRQRARQRRGQ